VPVTVVGDQTVSGFDRQELTRLFDLASQKEQPVAGPRLFDALDRVLTAVIRATRQVPPERMLWTTPDRDRPFKVFCYHILVDPTHVLDAIASGKYDGNFKLTYGEKAEPFGSMEDVARFGEECRARLRETAKNLSRAELDRPIDGYAGTTDGHELFHLILSHTAHHLRQLYAMLGMIGVEPADPLGPDDFQGIQMPKELW
jgi:DinB superfamily